MSRRPARAFTPAEQDAAVARKAAKPPVSACWNCDRPLHKICFMTWAGDPLCFECSRLPDIATLDDLQGQPAGARPPRTRAERSSR